MNKLKERLRKVRFGVPNKVRLIHSGEHFFHMSYLAVVGVGGHGFLYQASALALLLFLVLGLFIKGD